MDREKIFNAFRNCITEPKCKDCSWESCEEFNQTKTKIPLDLCLDILKLLKEQETEIRQLKLALDIAKGTCKGIVFETDEKFMSDL